MTSRILTACAIAALSVGSHASAQDLPAWNPQTICTEDSTPDHCGFLEGQARSQISQQWGFIPTLVRERCLTASEEEGTQSWRIFGDCLAASARAPDANEAEAAESDATASEANATDDSAARIAELETALEKASVQQKSGEVRIEGLQQRLMAAMSAQGDTSNEDAPDAPDAEAMQASIDEAVARANDAELRSQALQSRLTEALASAEDAGDADNARIAELEAELEKAQTESKRSNARISGLQERLVAAMDTVNTEAPAADTSAQDARIAELEADLEKAQTESKRGNARITGLQERLVAAMDAANVEAPAADTSAQDARIAELEAELEKAQTGLRSGEVRIEGLQARLLEAVDQSGGEAVDGSADIAALQDQLGVAESRIENLSMRLRNSREATSDARREGSTHESNLANARTRIATLQDAMIEARRTAQEQAGQAAAPDTEAAEQNARLERLLENQRERFSRVASNVSVQRSRIRELENEVRTLRRSVETAGARSCQQRMGDLVSEGGIQFANNKAEIRADAARTIDQLVAIARDCEDAKITVRGHTDSMGDRAYNVFLSERRAAAVVDYMTSNGIAPERIESVGVGPDEPVANNNTRAGRAQNRRIELLVN